MRKVFQREYTKLCCGAEGCTWLERGPCSVDMVMAVWEGGGLEGFLEAGIDGIRGLLGFHRGCRGREESR